jgi:hypothetical protein
MAKPAALGFRLHTGWAALVAVAGEPGKLEVLLRRRIELLPADRSVARFVYHEASKVSFSEAAALIGEAERESRETSRIAVAEALDCLRLLDLSIRAAGVPVGSRPVPKDLSAVLRSHPSIHTAEAALFQQAVAFACKGCGLELLCVRERDIWRQAAAAWRLNEAKFRKQIDALRKSVGAPWTTDQKTAAVFAVLALSPSC